MHRIHQQARDFRVGFDIYAVYLVGQLAYAPAVRAFDMPIDNEATMYHDRPHFSITVHHT